MNIKTLLGAIALFALHAIIIATPALAQERQAVTLAPVDVTAASTLPERAGSPHSAPRVRSVIAPAPRCSVRHTSFGPVRVCSR